MFIFEARMFSLFFSLTKLLCRYSFWEHDVSKVHLLFCVDTCLINSVIETVLPFQKSGLHKFLEFFCSNNNFRLITFMYEWLELYNSEILSLSGTLYPFSATTVWFLPSYYISDDKSLTWRNWRLLQWSVFVYFLLWEFITEVLAGALPILNQ